MWFLGWGVFVTAVLVSCGANEGEISSPKVSTQKEVFRGNEKIVGENVAKLADPGEYNEIKFRVDELGLEGPSTSSAGWTRISLRNNDLQDRHMGLVRLLDGKTTDNLRNFIETNPKATVPAWALQSGGPADVSPGLTSEVTLHLVEGNYALVRYVVGKDEVARLSTDGIQAFYVAPSHILGVEPTPDVVVTIFDYGFNVRNTRDFTDIYSSAIDSGSRIVKVINTGARVHEARLSKTKDGKQAKDFPDFYTTRGVRGGARGDKPLPFPVIKEDGSGPGGPPPGVSVGGVMAMQPGEVAYVTLNLEGDFYFLYDMLEDVEIQTSYLMRLMLLEFVVR